MAKYCMGVEVEGLVKKRRGKSERGGSSVFICLRGGKIIEELRGKNWFKLFSQINLFLLLKILRTFDADQMSITFAIVCHSDNWPSGVGLYLWGFHIGEGLLVAV